MEIYKEDKLYTDENIKYIDFVMEIEKARLSKEDKIKAVATPNIDNKRLSGSSISGNSDGKSIETSYGKSSSNYSNGEVFKELSRDDARDVVSNLLDNGEISMDDLQNLVPKDVPNTFVATDTIKNGAK